MGTKNRNVSEIVALRRKMREYALVRRSFLSKMKEAQRGYMGLRKVSQYRRAAHEAARMERLIRNRLQAKEEENGQ